MRIFCVGVCGFVLTACAAVYTDASDANQVTFLNTSNESLDQLGKKANGYCAQYGKVATYKSSDSSLVTVFACNPAR
jgi:TRAP-type uncharacterized transport system substrate-binding protein